MTTSRVVLRHLVTQDHTLVDSDSDGYGTIRTESQPKNV